MENLGFTLGADTKLTPIVTQICTLVDNELPAQPNINIERKDEISTEEDSNEDGSDDGSENESEDESEGEDGSESEGEDDSHSPGQVILTTNNNNSDLRTYYKTLLPQSIEDDVDIMKIADMRELYQLISSNCQHYVSIIENYKKDNLQTKFNMIVRRIEDHLLIKFKLNLNERWVEVGFFDENNTDSETMVALQTQIEFYLKNYETVVENRRKHIALQLGEQDDTTTNTNVVEKPKQSQKPNAIPDDHFDPSKNPDLAMTRHQLDSAGYSILPESLKTAEKELRTNNGITHDLDQEYNRISNADQKQKQTNQEPKHQIPPTGVLKHQISPQHLPTHQVPESDDLLITFKKDIKNKLNQQKPQFETLKDLKESVPKIFQSDYDKFIEMLDNHQKTVNLMTTLIDQLENQPIEYHPYIHNMLSNISCNMNYPTQVATFIHLAKKTKDDSTLINSLTETQKKIVNLYKIDLNKL